jgi:hypothetical protein
MSENIEGAGNRKGFRLHIDIPMGEDEAKACEISKDLMEVIIRTVKAGRILTPDSNLGSREEPWPIELLQYRLGNDEDRCVKNYLVKTENGHATKAKTQVEITPKEIQKN